MNHVAHCDDASLDPERYQFMIRWLKLLAEGLKNLGPDLNVCVHHTQRLMEAGFVNVEERIFKVPIGTWPRNKTLKNVGLYLRSVLLEGLQGISMASFTRGLGWSAVEVEALLVHVRKALMDSSQHTYFTFYAVYGQKPLR